MIKFPKEYKSELTGVVILFDNYNSGTVIKLGNKPTNRHIGSYIKNLKSCADKAIWEPVEPTKIKYNKDIK